MLAAFIACTPTWLLTAAGAALVFFFKGMKQIRLDTMLGFTGGVMVTASYFGLLGPAIEALDAEGFAQVMPAVVGALAVTMFETLLHYGLAFAARAMIYEVVEEDTPETQRDKYTDLMTTDFITGFVLMVALDLGLG